MGIPADKRHHKEWLKRHPEYVLRRLEAWVAKEQNPVELKRAKKILKEHQYLKKIIEKKREE